MKSALPCPRRYPTPGEVFESAQLPRLLAVFRRARLPPRPPWCSIPVTAARNPGTKGAGLHEKTPRRDLQPGRHQAARRGLHRGASRAPTTAPDLAPARGDRNRLLADLFVLIHANASPTAPSVRHDLRADRPRRTSMAAPAATPPRPPRRRSGEIALVLDDVERGASQWESRPRLAHAAFAARPPRQGGRSRRAAGRTTCCSAPPCPPCSSRSASDQPDRGQGDRDPRRRRRSRMRSPRRSASNSRSTATTSAFAGSRLDRLNRHGGSPTRTRLDGGHGIGGRADRGHRRVVRSQMFVRWYWPVSIKGEADEQGRREHCRREQTAWKIWSYLRWTKNKTTRVAHRRDEHREREVDVRAEIDLGREDGDDGRTRSEPPVPSSTLS